MSLTAPPALGCWCSKKAAWQVACCSACNSVPHWVKCCLLPWSPCCRGVCLGVRVEADGSALALTWVSMQRGLLEFILNSGNVGDRSPGSLLCCCGLCLHDLILTFGAEKWRCCCTDTVAAERHQVGLLGHLDREG